MLPPKFRSRGAIAGIAGIALCGAVGGALAAGSRGRPGSYDAAGGTFIGLRPTALGLPQIGESGTVGGGELTASLRTYHDSGDYERDLAAVGGAAKIYLDRRLAKRSSTADCTFKFKRVRGSKLYRRVKSCPSHKGKPAIVLDIDETSLSNYSGLAASGFTAAGLVAPAVGGTGTAIATTLALYQDARSHGVAVFFITGRPSAIQSQTEANLRSVGYDKGWNGLSFKPSGETTKAYKSEARAKIEHDGYDIVVNVGDQESDLDGGHAARAYKLPNPFYFVAD